MDIQTLMKAAIEAKKSPVSSDNKQKSKAKSLTDAITIARQMFLKEHPEAAKANRLFRPSKKQQEKEAKEKRIRLRKEPMSSEKNSFMSYQDTADFLSKQAVARQIKKTMKRGGSEIDALRQISKNPNAKLNKKQQVKLMKSKRKKYL